MYREPSEAELDRIWAEVDGLVRRPKELGFWRRYWPWMLIPGVVTFVILAVMAISINESNQGMTAPFTYQMD
jgi:hypothetical protein